MFKSQTPMVTIGMPVYNGADLIANAFESIRSQTYENLEIVVVDNASTDSTEETCRRFANSDPRVRYFRNDHNIGVAKNFNRAFDLAHGKYFKWAAHDDWIESSFVAECVTRLEADDSSVLCWTGSRFVDLAGNLSDEQPFAGNPYLLSSDVPVTLRFRHALHAYPGPTLYGLMRGDALRNTQLFRGTVGSDRVLLAELSTLGGFSWVPDILFFERHWPDERVGHYTSSYWDPTRKNQRVTSAYLSQAAQCVSVVAAKRFDPLTTVSLVLSVIGKYGPKILRRSLWSIREHMRRAFARDALHGVWTRIR